MVTISIRHNFPEVQRQLAQLQEDVAVRATTSAINRTLAQGRTRVIRSITARFNIKAGVVRERLRINSARRSGGRYRIEGSLESPSKNGRASNLIHFKAKQVKEGVRVQILKGSPAKVIRGAFIINKDNKYGGTVMIRRGKARLPIDSRVTIDVAQMFNARLVNNDLVKFMVEKFPEVFENEARYFTERFNARRTSL